MHTSTTIHRADPYAPIATAEVSGQTVPMQPADPDPAESLEAALQHWLGDSASSSDLLKIRNILAHAVRVPEIHLEEMADFDEICLGTMPYPVWRAMIHIAGAQADEISSVFLPGYLLALPAALWQLPGLQYLSAPHYFGRHVNLRERSVDAPVLTLDLSNAHVPPDLHCHRSAQFRLKCPLRPLTVYYHQNSEAVFETALTRSQPGNAFPGVMPADDMLNCHFHENLATHLEPDACLVIGLDIDDGRLTASSIRQILQDSPPGLLHERLAAKPRGDSGLSRAFEGGRHHAVRAYTETLLQLPFSPAQKAALLSERTPMMPPGLYYAYKRNHHQTVSAYCAPILASGLGAEIILDLIELRYTGRMGEFFRPLEAGAHETVAAFCAAVLSSALPATLKTRLVNPVCPSNEHHSDLHPEARGASGFYCAMRKGALKTVSAYVSAVLASGLPTADQIQILEARHAVSGKLGLFAAILARHAGVVTTFTALVLASELPENGKLRLLQACSEDKFLVGLKLAKEYLAPETISDLRSAILNSNLSETAKMLLQADL